MGGKGRWLGAGLAAAAAGALAFDAIFAQTGGVFDLSWGSIDGGGGLSTGSGYSLAAVVGQHDAQSSTGGPYRVDGGVLAAEYGPPISHKDYVPNAARDAP
jgi:hypothetical protein